MHKHFYSGEDLSGESINFIEPQNGLTNMKPRDINLPLNNDSLDVYFCYTFDNAISKNNLTGVHIARYKITDGKISLVALNPNIKIFTERDTTPPLVEIIHSDDPKKLKYRITEIEKTLKTAWYTRNDGEKIPIPINVDALTNEGEIQLEGLTDNLEKITLGAINYFRLSAEKVIYKTATPVNEIPFEEKATAYPNPFTNTVNITDNCVQKEYIQIVDMTGRIIFRGIKSDPTYHGNRKVLDTLKPGTYHIQIQRKSGKTETIKATKQ
jgi:hypothetical protein